MGFKAVGSESPLDGGRTKGPQTRSCKDRLQKMVEKRNLQRCTSQRQQESQGRLKGKQGHFQEGRSDIISRLIKQSQKNDSRFGDTDVISD